MVISNAYLFPKEGKLVRNILNRSIENTFCTMDLKGFGVRNCMLCPED
jgi:hypothetical protein